MAGNIVQDSCERTDANRIMTRDCHMMLTTLMVVSRKWLPVCLVIS